MAYNRVYWTNSPMTPLDAENLNNMDEALEEQDNRITTAFGRIDRLNDLKISISQGVQYAGKYLAVGSDGNVTLVDPPQVGAEPYAILTATHNLVETDTNYEILSKSEVEI